MKVGWQTRTLGDVCKTIQDGAHESPKKQFNSAAEGRFLYITSKNIRTNHLDLTDVSYVERDFHDRIYPRCQPRFGDVLLTKDGANTGNVTLNTIDEPFSLLSSVCLIKTNPTALKPAFLCYYIQSPDGLRSITGQMTGAAIKRIILRDIKLATIPLPPLPEQQRIVGIIDEAFDGIATAKANAEKNLQNARALFESHLQSVFSQRGEGWVEKTLGDVAQVKGGKRVPKGYKLLAEATEFPYLRVADFNDSGSINMSDLRYISAEVHREIKNYVIFSTDMYISIAGTIGKTGIIPKGLNGANLTENACRLVFNPGINNRFVYYFTKTPDFVEQAGLNTRTAAQPKLALSRLSTIKLGIPNLTVQKRLADDFDALSEKTHHLESIYQQKLARLDDLKKSLLHQALSGEL